MNYEDIADAIMEELEEELCKFDTIEREHYKNKIIGILFKNGK